MGASLIKSDKQQSYNQIRGYITEFNDGEKFCSITLEVGHNNTRSVNLIIKKAAFDEAAPLYSVGDKVCVKFFAVSRYKHGRWYTSVNVLEIKPDHLAL